MSYVPAALRRLVYERAQGCCEYCLLHEEDVYYAHEVDHIYAEKHGGETVDANLGLSCWRCNRFKGSDLASLDPNSGEPAALFHPRRHVWSEHFKLSDAVIESLTPEGRVTARLLHFSSSERVAERKVLIALGRYP